MSTATSFDFAPLLPAGLPAPAARWTGLAKYSFVGGNNDPDQVPVDGLIDAINAVLKREGKDARDLRPRPAARRAIVPCANSSPPNSSATPASTAPPTTS